MVGNTEDRFSHNEAQIGVDKMGVVESESRQNESRQNGKKTNWDYNIPKYCDVKWGLYQSILVR